MRDAGYSVASNDAGRVVREFKDQLEATRTGAGSPKPQLLAAAMT